MNRASRKLKFIAAVSIMLAAVLNGCGNNASNNDQGTSFTNLGYYSDTTGDTGVSGYVAPVNYDDVDQGGGRATVGGGLPLIVTYMGLSNNLSSQFINVRRVECEYEVPGADASLVFPSDSFNVGLTIQSSGDGGTSEGYIGFPVVGMEIYEFINVNKNSLPIPPFDLQVTCRAIGVTQAGDTLASNDQYLFVEFYEIPECCTGDGVDDGGGFQIGEAAGGDLASAQFGDPVLDGTADSFVSADELAGDGSAETSSDSTATE